MKNVTKIATLLAAITISAASHSQVLGVVEYDFNRVSPNQGNTHYGAAGLVYVNPAFFVDGYVQGIQAKVGPTDNMLGFEVGVGTKIGGDYFDDLTWTPRLAVGTMANINNGNGSSRANYAVGSIEVSKRFTTETSGYVGYSHTAGLNSFAIPHSNRLTIGIDYALFESDSIRFGLSTIRQLGTSINGFVLVYTKGF
jgi:hypothetical protein